MSIYVPLDRILDNPWQTRETYDDEYIRELAGDIERNGLLQPALGRVTNEEGRPIHPTSCIDLDRQRWSLHPTEVARVQIAIGHNRRRALRLLQEEGRKIHGGDGLVVHAMPVQVRSLSDEEMARFAWSENEQRKDLTPIEEARAIRRRMDDFSWTQADVAEHLGLARSTVANKLRLLELPDAALDHLRRGELSERQALAILPAFGLTDEEREALEADRWATKPEDLITFAIERNWSSDSLRREAESMRERASGMVERKQREEESRRKLEEKAATTVGGGKDAKKGKQKGVLTKRELGYDNYNDVSDDRKAYNYVEGCSPECTCRAQVIGYSGELEWVCTDPKRRRGLKAQATRSEKKTKRSKAEKKRKRFYEQYFSDGSFRWTPAAVRVMAYRLVAQGSNAKDVRSVLSELRDRGVITDEEREALDGLAGGTHDRRGPGLDALERLSLDAAVMIMLACLVEREFREYIEFAHHTDDYHLLMKSEPYGSADGSLCLESEADVVEASEEAVLA